MNRDYLEKFKGSKVEPIFVPMHFLSKFPRVVDYDSYIERASELKIINDINDLEANLPNESNPEKRLNKEKKLEKAKSELSNNKVETEVRPLRSWEKDMVKKLKDLKGEKAEKKLFEALQAYSKNSNDEMLVIYDLDFMKLGSKKCLCQNCNLSTECPKAKFVLESAQKDFIVLSLTRRCIIPIEVKSDYSQSSLEKSMEQLKDCKSLIESWIGGDLSNICGWKIMPLICFDEIGDIGDTFCDECKEFILHGTEIEGQLESLIGNIPLPNDVQFYLN